jgi:hypothetical protein
MDKVFPLPGKKQIPLRQTCWNRSPMTFRDPVGTRPASFKGNSRYEKVHTLSFHLILVGNAGQNCHLLPSMDCPEFASNPGPRRYQVVK